MTEFFHPVIFFLLGAVSLLILPQALRKWASIVWPLCSFIYIIINFGSLAEPLLISFGSESLTPLRADRLATIFGIIFSLVGVIGGIYSLHLHDKKQRVSAMLYNAGAIGVTFAGDYLTLYGFWELMAITSVVLIWARKRKDSQEAGMRYLITHLAGGAVLLAGIVLHTQAVGHLRFEHIMPESIGLPSVLLLVGFALNAAVPPLGAWLPDAYPKATVTGAVFCSALTTKTAVYTLIRGFAGWDILMIVGVFMALYGVVYAVLANDIRELLGYHIISQVGYMVAGCGLGTELAINGAVAHAVCHILYKSVLFMGSGIVIDTTGRSKMTELGGFYKRQKKIVWLYMIGALSISGFPFFNGFVSKSMVTAAAHDSHANWMFLLLMLASVGTFLHTGLKLPYGIWFGEDSGIKPKPAKKNMVFALALGGFFCVLLGCVPSILYHYLPYPVQWRPYTAHHLSEMIQILLFTFFAFYLFIPKLHAQATLSMDTDVIFRKTAAQVNMILSSWVTLFFTGSLAIAIALKNKLIDWLKDPNIDFAFNLPKTSTDSAGFDPDRSRHPVGYALSIVLLFLFVATYAALQ